MKILLDSLERNILLTIFEIEMCIHDTDLSILAAPKHVYSWYIKSVYQEYAQYERNFCKHVSCSFKSYKTQFLHPYFQPLEEKARYNLLTELGQLNAEYLVDHPGYKKL